MIRRLAFLLATTFGAVLAGAAAPAVSNPTFTVAVIPDTQNYIDYKHQRAEGFPIDAREMFFDQLAFIARNARSQGGAIVFATALGDVWQHIPSDQPDPVHARMGQSAAPTHLLDAFAGPQFLQPLHAREVPDAIQGYRQLDGKLPYSVVPGNHDYDATWFDSRFPPDSKAGTEGGRRPDSGTVHLGGVQAFQAAFGADTDHFRGKPWYVGAFRGGADSAQIFEAGGYCFLHIGLEMQPDEAALDWARGVIRTHAGWPTLVSIHQYLKADASRDLDPILNLALVHPEHRDPQALWDSFISRNDQIFMVLNGHQDGAARRVDLNAAGHPVHQLLSDYQARHQSVDLVNAKGQPKGVIPGVGDGWLRLMMFDLSPGRERVRVRTYSTYFKAFADEVSGYAARYKADEHPGMDDAAFVGQDEFELSLDGFQRRFRRGSCD